MSTATQSATGTAQKRLEALQEQRNSEWSTDQLAGHAALRERLEKNADRERFIKVGDTFESFSLPDVAGGHVVLADLLAQGPVVLFFFRFEGCPACNATLSGYRDTVATELRALGASIVAISPQEATLLAPIQERLGNNFQVASDPEATLIRSIGIAFAPDDDERARAIAAGNDLGATLGTGRWELPYPTTIVLDRTGVVRLVDVHPNWMVRTSEGEILNTVKALIKSST